MQIQCGHRVCVDRVIFFFYKKVYLINFNNLGI